MGEIEEIDEIDHEITKEPFTRIEVPYNDEYESFDYTSVERRLGTDAEEVVIRQKTGIQGRSNIEAEYVVESAETFRTYEREMKILSNIYLKDSSIKNLENTSIVVNHIFTPNPHAVHDVRKTVPMDQMNRKDHLELNESWLVDGMSDEDIAEIESGIEDKSNIIDSIHNRELEKGKSTRDTLAMDKASFAKAKAEIEKTKISEIDSGKNLEEEEIEEENAEEEIVSSDSKEEVFELPYAFGLKYINILEVGETFDFDDVRYFHFADDTWEVIFDDSEFIKWGDSKIFNTNLDKGIKLRLEIFKGKNVYVMVLSDHNKEYFEETYGEHQLYAKVITHIKQLTNKKKEKKKENLNQTKNDKVKKKSNKEVTHSENEPFIFILQKIDVTNFDNINCNGVKYHAARDNKVWRIGSDKSDFKTRSVDHSVFKEIPCKYKIGKNIFKKVLIKVKVDFFKSDNIIRTEVISGQNEDFFHDFNNKGCTISRLYNIVISLVKKFSDKDYYNVGLYNRNGEINYIYDYSKVESIIEVKFKFQKAKSNEFVYKNIAIKYYYYYIDKHNYLADIKITSTNLKSIDDLEFVIGKVVLQLNLLNSKKQYQCILKPLGKTN